MSLKHASMPENIVILNAVKDLLSDRATVTPKGKTL
jgi:hypothetical protein